MGAELFFLFPCTNKDSMDNVLCFKSFNHFAGQNYSAEFDQFTQTFRVDLLNRVL